MGVETTYMKHGKGPSGIIGITTNERAVRVWSNGHHLRGAVLNELESLRDTTKKVNAVHKEEQKGRISADTVDRVLAALKKCIHPLDVDHHASDILENIWSGEEAAEEVNVN